MILLSARVAVLRGDPEKTQLIRRKDANQVELANTAQKDNQQAARHDAKSDRTNDAG